MIMLFVTRDDVHRLQLGQLRDIFDAEGVRYAARCVCRYRHHHGSGSNPDQLPVVSMSPSQFDAVMSGVSVPVDVVDSAHGLLPAFVQLEV